MVTKTLYTCQFCNTDYADKEKAIECEKNHKVLETATNVGSRHGEPFIYKVRAKDMYNDGYKFFLSQNGVWLTKEVPICYLEGE